MFKVMTSKKLQEQFGVDPEEIDRLEEDASKGILHGEPMGPVMYGRPLKFGEEMKQVGFKEPLSTIDAIDERAKSLGLKRSDYLRKLVADDLASAGIAQCKAKRCIS